MQVLHFTMTKRFDISIHVRGSYKKEFGENYLLLKQEYGVDGAYLVKRVFKDAALIISERARRRADILSKKQELEKEERSLKTI
jgi:hypothetical protein